MTWIVYDDELMHSASFYYAISEDDSLYHHGRLGMRWGRHIFGDARYVARYARGAARNVARQTGRYAAKYAQNVGFRATQGIRKVGRRAKTKATDYLRKKTKGLTKADIKKMGATRAKNTYHKARRNISEAAATHAPNAYNTVMTKTRLQGKAARANYKSQEYTQAAKRAALVRQRAFENMNYHQPFRSKYDGKMYTTASKVQDTSSDAFNTYWKTYGNKGRNMGVVTPRQQVKGGFGDYGTTDGKINPKTGSVAFSPKRIQKAHKLEEDYKRFMKNRA